MTDPASVDVLIVEDEEHVAALLTDVLNEEGYRVVAAPDGPRGLEYAARYRPRLVLLDVMLPGLSGVEVLSRLHTACDGPMPAAILMSAAAPPAGRPPGIPFLAKPFNIDELLACVEATLQREEPDPATS